MLLGEYVAAHRATVRCAAKEFGISKSTVHKDLTERLPKISPQLFKSVKEVLEENKRERHIRGGIATKRKKLAFSNLQFDLTTKDCITTIFRSICSLLLLLILYIIIIQLNDALYSFPHFSIASKIGRMVSPRSLSEYSTLGGTSA